MEVAEDVLVSGVGIPRVNATLLGGKAARLIPLCLVSRDDGIQVVMLQFELEAGATDEGLRLDAHGASGVRGGDDLEREGDLIRAALGGPFRIRLEVQCDGDRRVHRVGVMSD